MTRLLALGVGLALLVPGGLGAQDRVYVTNQDDATVSIVSLQTFTVVETIDLRRYGFGPTAKPHHAQVEPDGSFWYLTLIGEGKVLKLNRANEIVASVSTEVPGLMALHPAADVLFVARSMSAVNPPSRVLAIQRSTFQVGDEVDIFFPRPHGLVLNPVSDRAFVASLGVNQFAHFGFDLDVRVVDVPGPAAGIVQLAVSPDGRWLALTAELTDEVVIYDVQDPAAPALAVRLPMPDGPFESMFTPDGQYLYVTALRANRVVMVETGSWTPGRIIEHEGFMQPHGLAVSPDGKYVLVSSRHQHGGAHDHEGMKPSGKGTLTVLCAATGDVVATVPVGAYAAGVGAPAIRQLPLPPARPCR